MIGNLPLWVLVMVWVVQRRNAPRMTIMNYPRMLRLLDDMLSLLPIPRTRLEKWMVARVTRWAEEEKTALRLLYSLNVTATGTVKR